METNKQPLISIIVPVYDAEGNEYTYTLEELKVDIGDVSVAFEEVSSSDWGEKVYKKEIRDNEAVYFKPNYEYK